MNIRIVADSSANLRTTEDKRIVSVPLKIITDQNEYTDDSSLDVLAMTEDLASYHGRSSTACPGLGDWLEAFGDADYVIGITITSTLSGSYNAARLAKEEYETTYPGRKVFIIDSLSAGPELKVIAEKLQELIAKGLEFDEICNEITKYQKRTFLVFSLKSLTNLANNGRVSPAVAKFANLLNIYVVGRASDQGDLEPKDKVRGEKKALLSIIKNMKSLGYVGGKVRIDHCFAETHAQKLKDAILELFPSADIILAPTYGLCSFYAENGGLLVGFES